MRSPVRCHKEDPPMTISPLAGKPAPKEMLIDPARLEREYFERRPDLDDPGQLVSFGTSGHRGSPLHGSFTEAHILAITQAICDYRRAQRPMARSTWARTRTRFPGRLSGPRSKSWRQTTCRLSSREMTGSRRRRPSRMPSSFTIVDAVIDWPTVLSLPHRTTRRRMAGSSTTRPMAGRPTPT